MGAFSEQGLGISSGTGSSVPWPLHHDTSAGATPTTIARPSRTMVAGISHKSEYYSNHTRKWHIVLFKIKTVYFKSMQSLTFTLLSRNNTGQGLTNHLPQNARGSIPLKSTTNCRSLFTKYRRNHLTREQLSSMYLENL